MLSLGDKHKTKHRRLMHMAGHLMYECAMRRQDAYALKWKHFTNEKGSVNDGYNIHFYCNKNKSTRTVCISHGLH